jgi:hypothetical protein
MLNPCRLISVDLCAPNPINRPGHISLSEETAGLHLIQEVGKFRSAEWGFCTGVARSANEDLSAAPWHSAC